MQGSRIELLQALGMKQAEKKSLLAELESYKECDPEVMEQMKHEAVVAKAAANRWTGQFRSALVLYILY